MSSDSEPSFEGKQSHNLLFSITPLFFSLTGLFGVTALVNLNTLAEADGSVSFEETVAPVVQSQVLSRTIQTTEVQTLIEEEVLSFEITRIPDATKDAGSVTVTQEGVNGSIHRTFEVVMYYGEEMNRTLIHEERIDPVGETVVYGTKPIQIATDMGSFSYTKQLTVYATSYDGNCKGCSGTTATGTPVYHGICAVDPKVIPLGTKFYVPGYGVCLAADTGGAIKGNKIDVGFENVQFGWWSSRWVDIYVE